jgi:hypothetical protein
MLGMWILDKALASSGISRRVTTVNEQRSWQRSIVPQTATEFLALPGSRAL